MDMQINKGFLRQEREKRAWSQSHLAEVADLSMRTVQRIEHNGVASMESAKALAAALDLNLLALTETSTPLSDASKLRKGGLLPALGSLAALLAVVAALGWWTTAAADQVMINLSIATPDGGHSDMHLLNDIGQQSEVKLENGLRVFVTSSRQGEFLLLATEIYDSADGEYYLLASPSL